MNATPIPVPPLKTVAAALRKTTEHLAGEVVRPSSSPPDWSEFEWAVARAAAAAQGISVLLRNGLLWGGPPAWEAFLEQQREHCVLRDARIGGLIERIDAAMRDAEIGCVALKGAALRTLGAYGAGERSMADVDLLVPRADAGAIAAVMRGLDYVPAAALERHTTYLPRVKSAPSVLGEHADNPIPIEVHHFVAEELPVKKIDITSRVQPERPRPGLNAYPSPVALLLHLLLHAAGNISSHSLRQIQLHDVAMLAPRLADSDWEALLTRAHELWWAFPPLALTVRYYECGVPLRLLRAVRGHCPPMLRSLGDRAKLTDVSWSNLRIAALPGIAWARTVAEAALYLRNRALPDRNTRVSIEELLRHEPQLDRVAWYQLSQSRRIVRWLVSRPPRVRMMLSVTAALNDAGLGQ